MADFLTFVLESRDRPETRHLDDAAVEATERGDIGHLDVCLFGFLTSSSTTRLHRGWAPRQGV